MRAIGQDKGDLGRGWWPKLHRVNVLAVVAFDFEIRSTSNFFLTEDAVACKVVA